MKREQRQPGIRSMGKPPEPKPCPICYRPMTPAKSGWECEKHGSNQDREH